MELVHTFMKLDSPVFDSYPVFTDYAVSGNTQNRKIFKSTFNRLVDLVMTQSPYQTSGRVFWIVDGGSAHHRNTFPTRLSSMYPNAVAVSLPVHASWLNQIEIYFSIVQRKGLTPNDFTSLAEVEERLLRFQEHYEQIATPFEWKFTRADLDALLKRLQNHAPASSLRQAA